MIHNRPQRHETARLTPDTQEGSSMESPTAGVQETKRSVDVGHSLSAAERETTVTITDADDMVRIWTAQRRYLGRLRRHPSFTEVKSGTHGGTEWAEFTIPARDWNPATGAKRKSSMSDEQKAALAERLRAVRAAS